MFVPRRSCSTGTKNKPTSLAWTQEKPYIDAGDPRVNKRCCYLSCIYSCRRAPEREMGGVIMLSE